MRKHAKGIAVGVALAVLTAVGVGVAAWFVSGTGDAYTRAGTLVAPTTVDASAGVTVELFPGEDGDLALRFHNTNGVDVEVFSIAGTGGPSVPANCLVTINAAELAGLTVVVPAGDDSAPVIVVNGAHMGAGADTTCQGQVITVPIQFQAQTV